MDSTNPTDAPESSGLERSPSHLLHRAQQWASERFTALFGDKEITLRQYALLAAVADQSGRSQTDLVRATGIDRSTLADMIKRMEHKGLLAREKSAKDGRAKSVRLTGKGKSKLNDARPYAVEADRVLLEALPKGRRRMFLETLELIAAAADAAEEAEVTAKQEKKREKKGKPHKGEKPARKKKAKAKDVVSAEAPPIETPAKEVRRRAKRLQV